MGVLAEMVTCRHGAPAVGLPQSAVGVATLLTPARPGLEVPADTRPLWAPARLSAVLARREVVRRAVPRLPPREVEVADVLRLHIPVQSVVLPPFEAVTAGP